jgi:predicted helicase
MGYPVTTDAGKIAEFLRKDGVKVVFSTYQSSAEIAKAQAMKDVAAFDLVISDEAHRTASALDSYFAAVLHNEKIKAERRLFMTATLKNYTIRVLQRAIELGDQRATMEDEKCYGKVFYQFSYAEALAHDRPPPVERVGRSGAKCLRWQSLALLANFGT